MWYKFNWKHRRSQWSNRKIAFVSILIATSVVFVIIFTAIVAIAAIPPFKLMAGGLPVKLTGYIFGPWIGAATGIVSDLISFMIRPTFYHFYYTIAWAVAGFLPGLIGYFMNRRWRKHKEVQEEFEKKSNNANFIFTLVVLASILVGLFTFIFFQPDSTFASQKLIKNKWVFLAIASTGTLSMLIAVIIFRFTMKAITFNNVLPIVVFSALLEVSITPLLTLGDQSSLFAGTDGTFLTNLTGHLLLSPIKIWGNLLVILFSYKIIAPLIYNKTNNGW